MASARSKAKALSLKYYHTGKPCKNGHIEIRNTNSGRCLACSAIYGKRDLEKNKDIRYLGQVKYRLANKESEAARHLIKYNRNRDHYILLVRNRQNNLKLSPIPKLELDELRKSSNFCPYCGANLVEVKFVHLDHILPVSRGGLNIISNVQFTCQPCNDSKGNKTHEEFLKWITKKEILECPLS